MPTATSRKILRDRVIRNLDSAYRTVTSRSNWDSWGSDGVTLRQFVGEWRREKPRIKEELGDGKYRFQPLRAVAIAKDSSKPRSIENSRPISIPAIRDRVVQRAILSAVWTQIRDRVYTDCSFGGIRRFKCRESKTKDTLPTVRKSVRLALQRFVEFRTSGLTWVFETDIKNFFPSIDRDKLLGDLCDHLQDDSITDLIQQAITTEIGNAASLGELAKLWDADRGVPQGGILSPILANFYLYPFDRAMTATGYRLIRYVDDLVVMTASEADAIRAYELALRELDALGLSAYRIDEPNARGIHKTRIVKPGDSIDFLGVTIHGSTIRPKDSKWSDLFARIDAATDVHRRPTVTLVEVIQDTNAIVRGWLNALAFCNINREQVERIDTRVRDRIGGWLCANTVTKDPNVLDRHRASLLGIRSGHEVEINPLIVPRSR